MTAIRSQIFAEIETRLSGIEGVTEVEVMPSGDPMSFDALHVFDDGQRVPADGEPGATRYDMVPEIVGYVEGGSGLDAHARLNELYAAVVKALVEPEPPLGGLAETIEEGDMRIQVAELASSKRLAFSLDLPITFPTRRGDPAQSA